MPSMYLACFPAPVGFIDSLSPEELTRSGRPSMSRLPSTFHSRAWHLIFELVIVSDSALESFRDLVKSPRLPSTAPVPQPAQDSGRL
jgi:hypothetical protein